MAALANNIYIGSVSDPLYHYDNAKLELGGSKGTFSVDVIGNELPIDTFTITIRYDPLDANHPDGKDALVYGVQSDTDPWDGEYLAYETAERLVPPKESAALYVLSQTNPAEYLQDIPYGTPIYWYISSTYFVKGYLKSVERIGKKSYKLTCISGVGLLDTVMHKGGLYTGQTVQTILASIVGSIFPYGFRNADARDTQVYGHLPYDTARNNLHRLLFATGISMLRGALPNDYGFGWLGNTITDIPASRVSINGSVQTQFPATKAEVTEHGFFQTANDEVLTLFDNTGGGLASVDHQLVIFNRAPVYNLAVTGTLVINESGVNYAIVTGTGTLTGKLYQHTEKVIELEENPDNNQERVVRVTDNELVSAVNSQNVVRRILNYYRSTKTVKGKLMLTTEKPGDLIQTEDAWGDATQGYLHKAEIMPTSVKGANVEIVDGYIASNNGNNYTHRVVLTGSGNFTVPDGVTNIRIILVGAGNGGQGGYDGSPGLAGIRYIPGGQDLPMDVWYTTDGGSLFPSGYTTADYFENTGLYPGRKFYYVGSQASQPGGVAGVGGAQGKVYVVDKDVTVGESIAFACGTGGTGGSVNGGVGTAGTATTASSTSIGSLTSDDGNTNGYYDPLAKQTYGIAGKKGYKGGNGGTSGQRNSTGCDGDNGVDGGSVAGYLGGVGGAGTGLSGQTYPAGSGLTAYKFLANGSGGGGAAYGNAGSPGGTFTTENVYWDDVYVGIRVNNAAGGAGADAVAPLKASYGNGGNGGNGGGAGGNASGVFVRHAEFTYNGYAMTPGGFYGVGNGGNDPAPGGAGSVGGDGGDGCVIIYY